MFKKWLVLGSLVALLVATVSFGGWETIPSPTEKDLIEVSALDQEVWILDETGRLTYRCYFESSQWKWDSFTVPCSTIVHSDIYQIKDIFCLDSSHIYLSISYIPDTSTQYMYGAGALIQMNNHGILIDSVFLEPPKFPGHRWFLPWTLFAVSATDIYIPGMVLLEDSSEKIVRGLVYHYDGNSVDTTCFPSTLCYGTSFLSSNNGWAVSASDGIIHWNGTIWSIVDSETGCYDIFFLSQNEGWAVGDQGKILRYNGSDWDTIVSPTHFYTLVSAYFTSSTDGWAVSDTVVHWDGNSWSVDENISGKGLREITGTSNHLWAVGNQGTLLHKTDSGTEETPNRGFDKAIVSISPNPFTHLTAIDYQFPNDSDKAILNIFDITGSLVRNEKVPRVGKFIWNGKDGNGKPLPSGIYFIRSNSERFAITRKMILLR